MEKAVKLKGLNSIYSVHLSPPRQVSPIRSFRESLKSPKGKKRRHFTPKKQPISERKSEIPIAVLSTQREKPLGIQREIRPIRLQSLSNVSGNANPKKAKHERSTGSVDERLSPYNIKYAKPFMKKNFNLLVDLEMKSAHLPPDIVVKKASKRKNGKRAETDKMVFSTLNSLL